MAVLTLSEVARRTGGKILQGSPGLIFRTFGIDSRHTAAGELFFAIKAQRDGHDFVDAAAAAGALGAVVSRPVAAGNPEFGLVEVSDTCAALRDLARTVLLENPVKIVGVTGSIGKTTTKEFTAALLATRFETLKSMGNFNNQLGLPLTLLRLVPEDEAAVLEMGMSAPGEIRVLTTIAPPDIAVITNIQPVHLQFFESLEGIALAKKEILDGAKQGATAVLNGDDPLVAAVAADWKGPRLTFGLSPGCDVLAEGVRHNGYQGLEFRLFYGSEKARVAFPFINEAYVPNLLAAAAVCRAFGFSLDEIMPKIAELRPSAMRGVLVELGAGIRLYDDSYNSSPRALDSALRSLAALPARRKLAVLADMLELGVGEKDFHRLAGEAVVRWGWDVLVTAGPLAAWIAAGAASAGMSRENIHSFPDSETAAQNVPGLVREGDLILVKGSRGMRAERIVAAVKSQGRE